MRLRICGVVGPCSTRLDGCQMWDTSVWPSLADIGPTLAKCVLEFGQPWPDVSPKRWPILCGDVGPACGSKSARLWRQSAGLAQALANLRTSTIEVSQHFSDNIVAPACCQWTLRSLSRAHCARDLSNARPRSVNARSNVVDIAPRFRQPRPIFVGVALQKWGNSPETGRARLRPNLVELAPEMPDANQKNSVSHFRPAPKSNVGFQGGSCSTRGPRRGGRAIGLRRAPGISRSNPKMRGTKRLPPRPLPSIPLHVSWFFSQNQDTYFQKRRCAHHAGGGAPYTMHGGNCATCAQAGGVPAPNPSHLRHTPRLRDAAQRNSAMSGFIGGPQAPCILRRQGLCDELCKVPRPPLGGAPPPLPSLRAKGSSH